MAEGNMHYEDLLNVVDIAFKQLDKKDKDRFASESFLRRLLYSTDAVILERHPKLYKAFREQFGERYAKNGISLEVLF